MPAGILPCGPLPPGNSKSGFELNSISLCCCCCCCCCCLCCSLLPGTPRLACPGLQFGFTPRWLMDVMLLLSLAGLIWPSCNSSYEELRSMGMIVGRCGAGGGWRCEGGGACVMPGIRADGTVVEDWVVCVWWAVLGSGATKRGSTSS